MAIKPAHYLSSSLRFPGEHAVNEMRIACCTVRENIIHSQVNSPLSGLPILHPHKLTPANRMVEA